jgi:hypothetical protein
MAQVLVLGAPDEGCAGKHGRSIPLADVDLMFEGMRALKGLMAFSGRHRHSIAFNS